MASTDNIALSQLIHKLSFEDVGVSENRNL
jgi:hypothetical protein